MASVAIVTSTNDVYNFDPTSGEARLIYRLPRQMFDIDFDSTGQMYGLGSGGNLYKIDASSGTLSYDRFLASGANALELFDVEGSRFGGWYATNVSGDITNFDDNGSFVQGSDPSTSSAGDLEGYGGVNQQLFWTSKDGYINEFYVDTGDLINFWNIGRSDMFGLADDGSNLHIFAGKDWFEFDRVNDPVFQGSIRINGDVFGAASLPTYNLSVSNPNFDGTPFDDLVLGSSAADVIFGGLGNDHLQGRSGNDFIIGGFASDRISGGEGSDVLDGGSGSDVLLGEVQALGPAQGQIFRLYETAFARLPDELGFEAWVGALLSGTPLEAAAGAFVGSIEFQQTYGALSNDDFVELLYANALGRASDADGKAAWVAALDAGALTREQAVAGFSESAEQVGRTQLAAQGFVNGTVLDEHAGQVFRMYDSALDRAPDAPGFASWLDVLDAGASTQALADAFLASPEFQAAYGALSTDAFVERLYTDVLDRASEPAGKAGWVNAIDSGSITRAQALQGFSESAEHVVKTNGVLDAYVTATLDRDTLIDGGADTDIMVGGRGADVFSITAGGGTTTIMGADRFDTLELANFAASGDEALLRATFRADGTDLVSDAAGHTLILADTSLQTFAELDVTLI